jgi:hypothetical protein
LDKAREVYGAAGDSCCGNRSRHIFLRDTRRWIPSAAETLGASGGTRGAPNEAWAGTGEESASNLGFVLYRPRFPVAEDERPEVNKVRGYPCWTTEGRLIRDRLQSVRSGRLGRMSDLAYFEYATVIPPEGNQREGTPAHYLVEVLISDPVTHKERGEAEKERSSRQRDT